MEGLIVKFFTMIEFLIGACFFSALGYGSKENGFGAFMGFLFGLIVVYSYCQVLKYTQIMSQLQTERNQIEMERLRRGD